MVISAILKKKGEKNAEKTLKILDDQGLQEKECQPSSPKRFRSSICGPLYHKNICVWCMKGSDKKILLEKLENGCEYQLFRDGGNLEIHCQH